MKNIVGQVVNSSIQQVPALGLLSDAKKNIENIGSIYSNVKTCANAYHVATSVMDGVHLSTLERIPAMAQSMLTEKYRGKTFFGSNAAKNKRHLEDAYLLEHGHVERDKHINKTDSIYSARKARYEINRRSELYSYLIKDPEMQQVVEQLIKCDDTYQKLLLKLSKHERCGDATLENELKNTLHLNQLVEHRKTLCELIQNRISQDPNMKELYSDFIYSSDTKSLTSKTHNKQALDNMLDCVGLFKFKSQYKNDHNNGARKHLQKLVFHFSIGNSIVAKELFAQQYGHSLANQLYLTAIGDIDDKAPVDRYFTETLNILTKSIDGNNGTQNLSIIDNNYIDDARNPQKQTITIAGRTLQLPLSAPRYTAIGLEIIGEILSYLISIAKINQGNGEPTEPMIQNLLTNLVGGEHPQGAWSGTKKGILFRVNKILLDNHQKIAKAEYVWKHGVVESSLMPREYRRKLRDFSDGMSGRLDSRRQRSAGKRAKQQNQEINTSEQPNDIRQSSSPTYMLYNKKVTYGQLLQIITNIRIRLVNSSTQKTMHAKYQQTILRKMLSDINNALGNQGGSNTPLQTLVTNISSESVDINKNNSNTAVNQQKDNSNIIEVVSQKEKSTEQECQDAFATILAELPVVDGQPNEDLRDYIGIRENLDSLFAKDDATVVTQKIDEYKLLRNKFEHDFKTNPTINELQQVISQIGSDMNQLRTLIDFIKNPTTQQTINNIVAIADIKQAMMLHGLVYDSSYDLYVGIRKLYEDLSNKVKRNVKMNSQELQQYCFLTTIFEIDISSLKLLTRIKTSINDVISGATSQQGAQSKAWLLTEYQSNSFRQALLLVIPDNEVTDIINHIKSLDDNPNADVIEKLNKFLKSEVTNKDLLINKAWSTYVGKLEQIQHVDTTIRALNDIKRKTLNSKLSQQIKALLYLIGTSNSSDDKVQACKASIQQELTSKLRNDSSIEELISLQTEIETAYGVIKNSKQSTTVSVSWFEKSGLHGLDFTTIRRVLEQSSSVRDSSEILKSVPWQLTIARSKLDEDGVLLTKIKDFFSLVSHLLNSSQDVPIDENDIQHDAASKVINFSVSATANYLARVDEQLLIIDNHIRLRNYLSELNCGLDATNILIIKEAILNKYNELIKSSEILSDTNFTAVVALLRAKLENGNSFTSQYKEFKDVDPKSIINSILDNLLQIQYASQKQGGTLPNFLDAFNEVISVQLTNSLESSKQTFENYLQEIKQIDSSLNTEAAKLFTHDREVIQKLQEFASQLSELVVWKGKEKVNPIVVFLSRLSDQQLDKLLNTSSKELVNKLEDLIGEKADNQQLLLELIKDIEVMSFVEKLLSNSRTVVRSMIGNLNRYEFKEFGDQEATIRELCFYFRKPDSTFSSKDGVCSLEVQNNPLSMMASQVDFLHDKLIKGIEGASLGKYATYLYRYNEVRKLASQGNAILKFRYLNFDQYGYDGKPLGDDFTSKWRTRIMTSTTLEQLLDVYQDIRKDITNSNVDSNFKKQYYGYLGYLCNRHFNILATREFNKYFLSHATTLNLLKSEMKWLQQELLTHASSNMSNLTGIADTFQHTSYLASNSTSIDELEKQATKLHKAIENDAGVILSANIQNKQNKQLLGDGLSQLLDDVQLSDQDNGEYAARYQYNINNIDIISMIDKNNKNVYQTAMINFLLIRNYLLFNHKNALTKIGSNSKNVGDLLDDIFKYFFANDGGAIKEEDIELRLRNLITALEKEKKSHDKKIPLWKTLLDWITSRLTGKSNGIIELSQQLGNVVTKNVMEEMTAQLNIHKIQVIQCNQYINSCNNGISTLLVLLEKCPVLVGDINNMAVGNTIIDDKGLGVALLNNIDELSKLTEGEFTALCKNKRIFETLHTLECFNGIKNISYEHIKLVAAILKKPRMNINYVADCCVQLENYSEDVKRILNLYKDDIKKAYRHYPKLSQEGFILLTNPPLGEENNNCILKCFKKVLTDKSTGDVYKLVTNSENLDYGTFVSINSLLHAMERKRYELQSRELIEVSEVSEHNLGQSSISLSQSQIRVPSNKSSNASETMQILCLSEKHALAIKEAYYSHYKDRYNSVLNNLNSTKVNVLLTELGKDEIGNTGNNLWDIWAITEPFGADTQVSKQDFVSVLKLLQNLSAEKNISNLVAKFNSDINKIFLNKVPQWVYSLAAKLWQTIFKIEDINDHEVFEFAQEISANCITELEAKYGLSGDQSTKLTHVQFHALKQVNQLVLELQAIKTSQVVAEGKQGDNEDRVNIILSKLEEIGLILTGCGNESNKLFDPILSMLAGQIALATSITDEAKIISYCSKSAFMAKIFGDNVQYQQILSKYKIKEGNDYSVEFKNIVDIQGILQGLSSNNDVDDIYKEYNRAAQINSGYAQLIFNEFKLDAVVIKLLFKYDMNEAGIQGLIQHLVTTYRESSGAYNESVKKYEKLLIIANLPKNYEELSGQNKMVKDLLDSGKAHMVVSEFMDNLNITSLQVTEFLKLSKSGDLLSLTWKIGKDEFVATIAKQNINKSSVGFSSLVTLILKSASVRFKLNKTELTTPRFENSNFYCKLPCGDSSDILITISSVTKQNTVIGFNKVDIVLKVKSQYSLGVSQVSLNSDVLENNGVVNQNNLNQQIKKDLESVILRDSSKPNDVVKAPMKKSERALRTSMVRQPEELDTTLRNELMVAENIAEAQELFNNDQNAEYNVFYLTETKQIVLIYKESRKKVTISQQATRVSKSIIRVLSFGENLAVKNQVLQSSESKQGMAAVVARVRSNAFFSYEGDDELPGLQQVAQFVETEKETTSNLCSDYDRLRLETMLLVATKQLFSQVNQAVENIKNYKGIAIEETREQNGMSIFGGSNANPTKAMRTQQFNKLYSDIARMLIDKSKDIVNKLSDKPDLCNMLFEKIMKCLLSELSDFIQGLDLKDTALDLKGVTSSSFFSTSKSFDSKAFTNYWVDGFEQCLNGINLSEHPLPHENVNFLSIINYLFMHSSNGTDGKYLNLSSMKFTDIQRYEEQLERLNPIPPQRQSVHYDNLLSATAN